MTETPPSARTLVTICTYNERDNLAELVRQIHEHADDVDVLIVDDNSPDGTGELADEMSAADGRVNVLHRNEKAGLGAATIAGFQWGIDAGYDFLLNMDADFSHHPRHLPAIRERMADADVVIGSRYVKGGGIEGWGWLRHFMSKGVNVYTRLFLRTGVRDNSGAYRCYRVSKLRELNFDKFRSRGYAFQEEMLYRCRRVGCRIVETPIVFKDRIHGSSKINLKEVIVALWDIFRLGTGG